VIADSDNPIHEVHYFNLRESMRNGGGPACLRLRVVLTEHEVRGCHQGVFLTESLYMQLREWVRKHYRDRLTPEDLADPQLALEVREALEALQTILRFEYL